VSHESVAGRHAEDLVDRAAFDGGAVTGELQVEPTGVDGVAGGGEHGPRFGRQGHEVGLGGIESVTERVGVFGHRTSPVFRRETRHDCRAIADQNHLKTVGLDRAVGEA
jgi:hypothetical protein